MYYKRTIVLIVTTCIAAAIWAYNIGSVVAAVPPDMADELATMKIHERDGRKFVEFQGSDGLFYCYWSDNDSAWPSEPTLVTEHVAGDPNLNTRCAYKTFNWVVAPNRSYPDAPVYDRELVNGKRVKLKKPDGTYFRAPIGMVCGGHTYYPSTNGREWRDVNFIIDGVRIRGMSLCEQSE